MMHPSPAARYELYAPIHKALRAFMTDTLTAVGRMDAQDAEDLQQTLTQLGALLDLLQAHLTHENDFVHPAIEAGRAGAAAHIERDHVEHRRELDALRAASAAVSVAPAGQRGVAALALYRQLALFVAENFEHMHYEETEHQRLLTAVYTDAELLALEQRIVASLSPETAGLVMRWMLPYLNHAERSAMLCGMRQQAPAEVFDGVMALAREHLRPRDWFKLVGSLSQESSPTRAAA